MSISTPILTQQISNHPVFTDVERYVDVTLQSANSKAKRFEFWFEVRFIRDGEDVTQHFSQPSTTSIFTDDKTKLLLRDPETFEPIPNPEWDGVSDDEYDMYLWVYGWYFIMDLINQPTNIAETIRQYILLNDSEGFFNQ